MVLIPGVIGFLAFCLFDINKIRWHCKSLNLLFAFGGLLLLLSTLLCIPTAFPETFCFDLRRITALLGLALSGPGLVYVLFFALPFTETYTESGDLPLVNRGVYGACRHPGFWMFAVFYFFLWLFFTGPQMFWAFLLYPTCNLLYIYVQDRYIFPQYIRGYDDYKRTVPFVIPTKESIRNAFSPKGE